MCADRAGVLAWRMGGELEVGGVPYDRRHAGFVRMRPAHHPSVHLLLSTYMGIILLLLHACVLLGPPLV